MKKQSISVVWKPVSGNTDEKIQGSCEVTALKLSSGNGAAVVAVYDATSLTECNENSLRWFLDASTTDNDAQSFDGLVFKKGVYLVCEQGVGFNPVVCVAGQMYVN